MNKVDRYTYLCHIAVAEFSDDLYAKIVRFKANGSTEYVWA